MSDTRHTLTFAPDDFWFGDKTLLTWPTAAVLNSRQGRYPTGGEAWVKATVDAAMEAARRERVLIAGLGLLSWEIGVWAAGEALGALVLLAPIREDLPVSRAHEHFQAILQDFGLTHQPTLIVPWLLPKGVAEKNLWHARDRWILEQADHLLPVSIRPGGSLEAILAEPQVSAKVDDRFRVDYAPRRHPFAPAPKPEQVRRALEGFAWEHAAHWTRIAHDPWPGESHTDFYSALVQAKDRYPRDAEATLARILREGRLRGSSWRMPMGQPMVSFTELPPEEMVPRMTWRQRYLRPAFEPWGIAVKREALRQFGGRPVRYGSHEERLTLKPLERLFFQVRSEVDADWESEREWRFRGDLELPPDASDQVAVFVPDPAARERIAPLSPFEVVSLT